MTVKFSKMCQTQEDTSLPGRGDQPCDTMLVIYTFRVILDRK